MYKVISILLIAITFNAAAQLDNQKLKYAQKAERYRKMRSIGTAMIVVGSGLFVYGVVKISQTSQSYNTTTGSYNTNNNDLAPALALVGGIYLVGGGIPLTIIGARKTRQYEEKLQISSLSLGLSNHMPGLSLTLKFK